MAATAEAAPTLKTCSRCERELPPAEFHKRVASVDGLAPHCKECAREKGREYRGRYAARNGKRDAREATPEKSCRACTRVRSSSEFDLKRNSRDGLNDRCKECVSKYSRKHYERNGEGIRQRVRDHRRKYPERHAERDRRKYLREKESGQRLERRLRSYGLSLGDYQALRDAQDGACAICGDRPEGTQRGLVVDHDHESGEVRGLLCNGCNRARLGKIKDSVDRARARLDYYEERARCMRNAIEYLTDPPARRVLGGGD